MDKKFTDEEIVKAAKHCITNDECDNCPFVHELQPCKFFFAQYIVDTAKQTHIQDVLNDFERYISPFCSPLTSSKHMTSARAIRR